MTQHYKYVDCVRDSTQLSHDSSEDDIYEEFGNCDERLYEFGYDAYEDEENEYEDFDPTFRRRSLSQGAAMLPNKNFMKGIKAKIAAGSKGSKLGALLKDKQLFGQQVKKLTQFSFNKKGKDMTSSNPKNSRGTRSLDKLWRKKGVYNNSTSQKSTDKEESFVKEEVDNIIYSSNSPNMEFTAYPPPKITPKRNLPVYETVNDDFVIMSPITPTSPHNGHHSAIFQFKANVSNSDYEDAVLIPKPTQTKPQIPKKPITQRSESKVDLLVKQFHQQLQARDESKSNNSVSTNYRINSKVTSPIRLENDDTALYDRLGVSR